MSFSWERFVLSQVSEARPGAPTFVPDDEFSRQILHYVNRFAINFAQDDSLLIYINAR
jgi:hypothetical protein